MKKQILATALLLTTVFASSRANDGDQVSKATYASFNKDFQTAKVLGWQKQQNFEVATFNLNGQVMLAYYNQENTLVAILHHVTADHLPILLLRDLRKNYANYWVSDLFEAASNGESHYYLTLENGDQVIKLKSNDNDWSVTKKICKDTAK